MTNRYLERLDRPLRIEEVREGLPALGWKLARDDHYHLVSEENAKGRRGVVPGLYRALVFESQSGRVAWGGLFDPDTGEMRMTEYWHLRMDVVLPIPNNGHLVPAAEIVEVILARLAEGAIGPPGYWEEVP